MRARIAAGLIIIAAARVGAFEPMRSYLFDFWGNPAPAPQPYELAGSIDGAGLGVGSFVTPFDVCVAPDGGLYVSDTGNGRVVRVAPDLASAWVIDAFSVGGAQERFASPNGLYVTPAGELFVADKEAGRVLRFDPAGDVTRVYGAPSPDIEGAIPADFVFKPVRIAASPQGKLYVAAEGVYDGLMEYDIDGGFVGFIGAPRVAPNPLDIFWSRFATRAQKRRISLFLPTEYSSLDLDERGFIYATEKNEIRRLNPGGQNIFMPRGFAPPRGDLTVANQALEKPSHFTDIAVRPDGIVSVLDLERGRVFTYDGVGNLLYLFGGIGLTRSLFQSPSGLAARGEQLLVVDRTLNRILVFRPLPFARAVDAAVGAFESGRYDEAAARWREVLALNVNDDLAYTGIGRSLLQKGRFAEAMANFQLGNDRRGYSEAFRLDRRQRTASRFGRLVLALALVAAAIWAFFRFSPVRRILVLAGLIPRTAGQPPAGGRLRRGLAETLEGFLYAGHVSYHPYDGFWDLKFERRGNVPSALMLLVAFCIAYLASQQYLAFLFNVRDQRHLNVLVELASILAPLLGWCVVNWALSILLEGKGTFREIVIATVYAFTPLTVSLLAFTILSGFVTLEEGAFLYLLLGIGGGWSAYLLFAGTLTVHEYTVARTIASIILTIVGIGVVIFIGLLFFSVVNLMIGFVSSVYGELVLRF